MPTSHHVLKDAERHRRALFGLCYRMTGCPADAEDLVQETFRRALERPPSDLDAPLRPWLFKVATNLCIDDLRRRGRYFGPWLPGPVPTEQLVDDLEPGPEARLGVLESASAAFLLATHALEPRARAVLILRDVLGLSAAEVADLLDVREGNVRVLHHRARRAIDDAEVTLPADDAPHREALRKLLFALGAGDAAAVATLLTDDAVATHDANGEYVSAVRPIRGRDAILAFYEQLRTLTPMPIHVEERSLNGLPAIALRYPERLPRYARRVVFTLDVAPSGRVRALGVVVAPRKLAAVFTDER